VDVQNSDQDLVQEDLKGRLGWEEEVSSQRIDSNCCMSKEGHIRRQNKETIVDSGDTDWKADSQQDSEADSEMTNHRGWGTSCWNSTWKGEDPENMRIRGNAYPSKGEEHHNLI